MIRFTCPASAGAYDMYLEFGDLNIPSVQSGTQGLRLINVQHPAISENVDILAVPAASGTAYLRYTLGRKERTSFPVVVDADASDLLWAKYQRAEANAAGSLLHQVDHFPDSENEEEVAIWRDTLFTKDEGRNRMWFYQAANQALAQFRGTLLFELINVSRERLIPTGSLF